MLETGKLKEANNIVASVQTDVGCVREANEDSGRHVLPNDPETRVRKGTLTIVADGMGGHASGEIASQMAVELISEIYYADKINSAPGALKIAVERANREIYETSLSDEKYYGMGTTVIALVLQNGTAFSAHVGDSRLYRLRAGAMEMLTLDHSQVMEMVKHGILTMEEARNHDDKNVILRAVGTQPVVEAEVSPEFPVESGDEFLLCSDGLCDMLPDAEIAGIWRGAADVHTACEQLIEAAKQSGGHDNITVGIVRVAASGETQASGNVRVTREIEIA
ncbi:MAG TPA: Stp1/IreP family PP2C-type Ser/Thr phosphatase [Pyrinomonadaceae bacterium]|nr:Stp1/IreP family PP2C-type Ser/Thr phosphatase [Pyrinomonadaceae bacterium]